MIRRILLAALLPASCSWTSGCVMGVTQAAFASARSVEVFGPPERAWVVHDELVIRTAPLERLTCGMPFAGPLERYERPQPAALLVYRLPERPDAGELPIDREEELPEDRVFDPPPCATEVPLRDLHYRLELRRSAGARDLWVVPQALALPVAIAADLALLPVYGIGALVALLD